MLDDDGGLHEVKTEINVLAAPRGQCQWSRGCSDRATHNVCQYNPVSLDTLDGPDLLLCPFHARAMKVRLEKIEGR